MKILIFVLGFFFGGLFGVAFMCLFQINSYSEERLRDIEEKHNEKK